MTEQELRALVREAVARNAAAISHGHDAPAHVAPPPPALSDHPSHAQYFTLVNIGSACVIEPSVECNHCGYCKSHGH